MTTYLDSQAFKSILKRKGRKQKDLAQTLSVTVETVNRWANSRLGIRQDKLEEMARALGVEAEELCNPPTNPELTALENWLNSRDEQLNVRIKKNVRNELLLCLAHYRLTLADLVEYLPLMFNILAERSLLSRQEKLDEAYEAWDAAYQAHAQKLPHLPQPLDVHNRDDNWEHLRIAEQDSIDAGDVTGNKLRAVDADAPNPFLFYLKELAAELPENAKPSIDTHWLDYETCDDTLTKFLESIKDETVNHKARRFIRSGEIDLKLLADKRRELSADDFSEWVKAEVAAAEQRGREILDELNF